MCYALVFRAKCIYGPLKVENIKREGKKRADESATDLSRLSYIEIDDLSHLLKQWRSSTGEYTQKNWRESYYFNATDEKTGLSLITTIGTIPNKRRRCTGFVIVLRRGRIVIGKPLLSRERRLHETDRFRLGKLSFQVEGIDWRLVYRSRRCDLDILFRPLNEFYSYIKDLNKNGIDLFRRLASQHIEQAGIFEGKIKLDGQKIKFGPCPGHRDHSWGIRDWAAIDKYWLFSGTFGRDKAFNLWKGTTGRKKFLAGYIFESGKNLEIVSSKVRGQFALNGREPMGCRISFTDEIGREHQVNCEVVCSVPMPMPKCIVYETIARMEYGKEIGYGLLERHVHDANLFHKVGALLDIKKRRERRKH